MTKSEFRRLRQEADAFLSSHPSARAADFAAHLAAVFPAAASRAGDALSGARQRAGMTRRQGHGSPPPPSPSPPPETDEERRDRITRQYNTLSRMATRIIDRKLPALIVSGPPGLGKTYTVEQRLSEVDSQKVDIIRGTVSGAGLYIALWNQADGGTVVLDDCDSVFRDEETLNILKIVLDSGERRIVSWRKRASWLEDLDIPDSFEFTGSIVFCTNIDFETEIARGSKLSVHYRALIDRSLYLCLTLRNRADYIERIKQVCIDEGQFVRRGLTADEAQDTMGFIIENAERFYTLSIRSAIQVAQCRLMDPEHWQDDVRATKMRTLR